MSDESDNCFCICPYCGYSYQAEAEDYSETIRDEECDKCKKTFIRYDVFEVTHHTEKKEAAK